jgi:hypothetical protein
MVDGGRKEKYILFKKRMNDGRVGRCGATPELLPLGKVMQARSGNRCKRQVHHLDKREETGWSHRQHHSRQR